jgi:hypothetical protein
MSTDVLVKVLQAPSLDFGFQVKATGMRAQSMPQAAAGPTVAGGASPLSG